VALVGLENGGAVKVSVVCVLRYVSKDIVMIAELSNDKNL